MPAESNMLLAFIFIPLLTLLCLLAVKDLNRIRWISAAGMGLQLLNAIHLLVQFLIERSSGNLDPVLFEIQEEWYTAIRISLHFGVDGISVVMVVLTAIVTFAGIFASWTVSYWTKEFYFSLILLSMASFGFFISLDLFTLFFFYELAVIPMYLLIGIWGSGTKEYAAMKLTLMLMGGSALLMVGLLGLYFYSDPTGTNYTFDMLKIASVKIPIDAQRFFFPLIFVGFGIIGALFPLHTWSPDGHSAAPTAASMVHAGVLMKLGGYGCLKVATMLLPEAANEMSWIFIVLATAGVIYGAYTTIIQTDLKYINAYSSVSHCALVLLGICMLNRTAMTGAVLQMFSHGVMTALFFSLIGMIYERSHTRDITRMGGLLKVIPYLGTVYIIAGLCSLGLPGFSGFVAEITVFIGAFQNDDMFHRVATIIATTSIVVTAVYILRVVGIFLLGPVAHEEYHSLKDARWFERVATVTLLSAIVIVGIYPFWFSDMIYESLGGVVMNLGR
ncbi:MAG: NADH-quinone oxidoreductase subunit M [Bacteroidetes bacterium]|nr:NADH-quinone oxidoreductase subunit M [Bacteroidota bacterium]